MTKRNNKTPLEPTTFHQLAQAGLELEGGGRFAADVQIVGAAPTTDYPASGVPQADAGLEPPTGENIDALEPTGTPTEVLASIERAERERGSE